MAQKSYRKSQLIAFNNAAAGHDGVLSDPSGAVVIKPCKQAEIDFYHSTSSHPHFAIYIPTFMGTLSLNSDPDPSTTLTRTATMIPTEAGQAVPVLECPHTIAQAPVVEKAWAPSNGGKITTDLAIVLGNIAAAFKKPNILDVKLGARLWDDYAPPAKRAKLDKVAEETTSRTLGFRVAGMRTWQGPATVDGDVSLTHDGYKVYDKHYGKSLTVETVRQGFEDFFLLERGGVAKGPVRKVINRFLEDLDGLLYVLEREESRMYSASLLFVYEGHGDALRDALSRQREDALPDSVEGNDTHEDDDDEEIKPAVQALKLIDFAHAEWTPGKGPDENLLQGLRSTIKILEGLLKAS
ncbi:MAG: hypothetical protein Q9181_002038 [Wetmoreana brouardii]